MRKRLLNILLSISSIVITYAILEFLFIPFQIKHASLNTQSLFPPAMRILSQNSKDSLIPKNYILIMGDSYAMGVGDWLNSVDKDSNPAYHAAHVIHQLSGRDVISFGKSGAGSITGLVTIPVRWFFALRRFDIPPPETILVYFYEGNDVTDNIGYLRRHYYDNFDIKRIYDHEYFNSFLDYEVGRRVGFKKYTDWFYLGGYIIKLYKSLKNCILEDCNGDKVNESRQTPPGVVNRITINNKRVFIPDNLQSPALELTPEEISLSLHVFEESLRYMMGIFRNADIHVIYIPSPLSSYRVVSDEVSVQSYERDISLFPSDKIDYNNELIKEGVAMIAGRNGAGYFDATIPIRRIAETQFVHGPVDWKHLNKKGYTVLGRAIVEYLNRVKLAGDKKL